MRGVWQLLVGGTVLSAVLVAGGAALGGTKLELVQRASYPALYSEGPVIFEDRLLVAEMDAGQVSELGPDGLKPFWKEERCGPTSIAPLEAHRVVVLCHSGGYLAILSATGELLDTIDADGDGNALVDPNDCAS